MFVIEVPDSVKVELSNNELNISGPKGSIKRWFRPSFVSISLDGSKITINGKNKMHENTARAHIQNMITGVTDGFERKMVIRYAHFPMNVEIKGKDIIIKNFIGEKVPRKTKISGDVTVKVKGQELIISGINKEDVGQTVANIRAITRIKGKDPRIFQDGIYPAD